MKSKNFEIACPSPTRATEPKREEVYLRVTHSAPQTMKSKNFEIACPSPTKATELKNLEPFSPSLFINSIGASVQNKSSIFKFPEGDNFNWDKYPSPASYQEVATSPVGFKRVTMLNPEHLHPMEALTQIPSPLNAFVFPPFSPTTHFQHYFSPKNMPYTT